MSFMSAAAFNGPLVAAFGPVKRLRTAVKHV